MSVLLERKIDCHNHVFDPENFPYQPDRYHPQGHEISPADYFLQVLDTYHVSHALVVGPNSGYGEDDNRALLDAIRRSNGRFKGMAVVSQGVSDETLLALKHAGIVGVTFNVAFYGIEHFHYAEALMAQLHRCGLLVQIQVIGDQLLAFEALLKRTPATVVIDHCGRPELDNGIDAKAFQALLAIARDTQHSIKLSGMAKFSKQGFPFSDTKEYVMALFEAFGEDRVLWGSDWPFLLAPQRMDYGTLLTLAEAWFPNPDVREKYFWRNAARLFGFE